MRNARPQTTKGTGAARNCWDQLRGGAWRLPASILLAFFMRLARKPIISNDLTFAADAEAAAVEIVGESMPSAAIDEATIRILGCRLNDKCRSEAFQGMSVSFKSGVSRVGWWKLPKTPGHKTECGVTVNFQVSANVDVSAPGYK